jgi:uncharacterized membrane protein
MAGKPNGTVRCLHLLASGLVLIHTLSAQSLRWIAPEHSGHTEAHAVSADGKWVVGFYYVGESYKAFLWHATEGFKMVLPQDQQCGGRSSATGISSNGSVVVGHTEVAYQGGCGGYAFRWTPDEGARLLTSPSSATYSRALGVSANGAVVVGEVLGRPFRWDDRGLETLSENLGEARFASADGSVVVGWVSDNPSNYNGMRPFRWTKSAGMQLLEPIGALATAVSADGSVVVGYIPAFGPSRLDYPAVAYRWNAAGQAEILPGNTARGAFAVTADGLTIVGTMDVAAQLHAARWNPDGSVEDLNQTYSQLLSPGSFLKFAYGISPDGRYIVGEGYNAATGRLEAFLLDTQGGSGVAEESGATNVALSLFPHLVQGDAVTIGITASAPLSNATILLYDPLGRLVGTLLQDATLPAGTTAVPVSVGHLPSGTYTVVLRSSAGTAARQMVIAR